MLTYRVHFCYGAPPNVWSVFWFQTSIIISGMIAVITPISLNFYLGRGSHWIDLEPQPLRRNTCSSGGLTIDPHFLWGNIPSSFRFTYKVHSTDILRTLWQEGSFSISCWPPPRSAKGEMFQFRFRIGADWWGFVALPFTVLYFQDFYYFIAFPGMSSWGQVQAEAVSGALIGRTTVRTRPMAAQCGIWLSWEWAFGKGRGAASLGPQPCNVIDIYAPKHLCVFPRPADGGVGETAVLTLTPELQYYSSQPLNEKERRKEGGGFWGEKTEQSNISGPAIPK